jgi:hypothetical protein
MFSKYDQIFPKTAKLYFGEYQRFVVFVEYQLLVVLENISI